MNYLTTVVETFWNNIEADGVQLSGETVEVEPATAVRVLMVEGEDRVEGEGEQQRKYRVPKSLLCQVPLKPEKGQTAVFAWIDYDRLTVQE